MQFKTTLLAAAVLTLSFSASAQTAARISATWSDAARGVLFTDMSRPAGYDSVSTTAGGLLVKDANNNSFIGFCLEPYVRLPGGKQSYVSTPLASSTLTGAQQSALQGLYSSSYANLGDWRSFPVSEETKTNYAAFQMAVWEIVRETGSVGKVGVRDSGKGSFYFQDGVYSDLVAQTNSYLNSALTYSGPAKYDLTAFTSTRYQDVLVGNVAAIPEPETYALISAGLLAVGFVTRRRRGQAQF